MLCVLSSLVLGVVPCVKWTLSTNLPPNSTYLPFLIRKERGFLKLLSKFKPKTKNITSAPFVKVIKCRSNTEVTVQSTLLHILLTWLVGLVFLNKNVCALEIVHICTVYFTYFL